MRMKGAMLAFAVLIAAPALADEGAGVGVRAPRFGDLERWHARDKGTALALERVQAAVPAGTSLAAARQAFVDAGAECTTKRKAPNALRCLIHQFTFVDRSPDDIRWTIVLHHDGAQVTAVTLDRYVDRHWTG